MRRTATWRAMNPRPGRWNSCWARRSPTASPSGRSRAARCSRRETLPAACGGPFDSGVGKVAGFSLHAGVAARTDQRQKLERLCRYISRPAVAKQRLSLTPNGNLRYQLKTPYRDGTMHVMLLRASCPAPFGPAFGCSKSLPAILSNPSISSPDWWPWCPSRESTSLASTGFLRQTADTAGV